MTGELSKRCGELLTGAYDCVDRIVLNAHFLLGYSPGGFGCGGGPEPGRHGRRCPKPTTKDTTTTTTTQPELAEIWSYYQQSTRVPPAELKARTRAKDHADNSTETPAQVPAPARPVEPSETTSRAGSSSRSRAGGGAGNRRWAGRAAVVASKDSCSGRSRVPIDTVD